MATVTLATSVKATRTAGVPFEVGPFVVAGNLAGEYQLVADLDPAEYLDPANQIIAELFTLEPDGLTWRHVAGNRPDGWRGGAFTDPEGNVNPPPMLIAFNGEALRGKTVKMVFVTGGTFAAGYRLLLAGR